MFNLLWILLQKNIVIVTIKVKKLDLCSEIITSYQIYKWTMKINFYLIKHSKHWTLTFPYQRKLFNINQKKKNHKQTNKQK